MDFFLYGFIGSKYELIGPRYDRICSKYDDIWPKYDWVCHNISKCDLNMTEFVVNTILIILIITRFVPTMTEICLNGTGFFLNTTW